METKTLKTLLKYIDEVEYSYDFNAEPAFAHNLKVVLNGALKTIYEHKYPENVRLKSSKYIPVKPVKCHENGETVHWRYDCDVHKDIVSDMEVFKRALDDPHHLIPEDSYVIDFYMNTVLNATQTYIDSLTKRDYTKFLAFQNHGDFTYSEECAAILDDLGVIMFSKFAPRETEPKAGYI